MDPIAKMWSAWLPSDALQTIQCQAPSQTMTIYLFIIYYLIIIIHYYLPSLFITLFRNRYGGYYTTLIRSGFRLISLNTQYCDINNFYVRAYLLVGRPLSCPSEKGFGNSLCSSFSTPRIRPSSSPGSAVSSPRRRQATRSSTSSATFPSVRFRPPPPRWRTQSTLSFFFLRRRRGLLVQVLKPVRAPHPPVCVHHQDPTLRTHP
jgi:hypothetical protein